MTYPGPEKASTPALFTVALSGKMNVKRQYRAGRACPANIKGNRAKRANSLLLAL